MKEIHQIIAFCFFCISASVFSQKPPHTKLQTTVSAEITAPLTVTPGNMSFGELRTVYDNNHRYFMMNGKGVIYSSYSYKTNNDHIQDFRGNSNAANIEIEGSPNTEVTFEITSKLDSYISNHKLIYKHMYLKHLTSKRNSKIEFIPQFFEFESETELNTSKVILGADGKNKITLAGSIFIKDFNQTGRYEGTIEIEFKY